MSKSRIEDIKRQWKLFREKDIYDGAAHRDIQTLLQELERKDKMLEKCKSTLNRFTDFHHIDCEFEEGHECYCATVKLARQTLKELETQS